MIRAAIVGLGSWGQNLVNSVQGKSSHIRFVAGAVRTLTGGLMAAFFRWKLQGDDTRLDELERGSVEGLEVTRASR